MDWDVIAAAVAAAITFGLLGYAFGQQHGYWTGREAVIREQERAKAERRSAREAKAAGDSTE